MTDKPDLRGKVCVVTGAAGVLCSTLVEALLAGGAKVALLGRTESKLIDLVVKFRNMGLTETMPVAANVLDRPSLEAAREAINRQWGPVELLVNGAGGNNPKATTPLETLRKDNLEQLDKSFFGLDVKSVQDVFELNFSGTLLPCMVFGQDMLKLGRGNIINLSSMGAIRPLTKVAGYSAAKAAVSNLTQWLSVHLAPMNIRVNAIAPGFFVTEQNRFLLLEKDGQTLTARGEKIMRQTPMARFGDPADLRGALLYLASDMSKFVTGVVLPVDGGFSAYSGV